jgi:hypothetical protein
MECAAPRAHDPAMHVEPISVSGPVTPTLRQRVNLRTHELAMLADRGPLRVVQADYEQAKRELTGETDHERQSAAINAPSEPGNPVRAILI